MTLGIILERSVAPLDRARRSWFRFLERRAWTSALLADREKRLAFLVSSHAVLAAWLAVHFPVHLFLLGPVVLGVPHVAADVRYLVLRQNLPAWWRRALWTMVLAFAALATWGMLHDARDVQRLELGLGAAFIALSAFASGAARRRVWHALACVLAAGAFACAAAGHGGCR